MDVSLCRVTAGRGLEWPEFVALAGRTGYDAVDMELEAVRRDGVTATLALLKEHGVKPGVCNVPTEFRQDEDTFKQGMRELDEFARLAAEIGCPRMVTWVPPTYETPRDQMRKILLRRFSEMGRTLRPHGVRLGLEFISPLHFRSAVTPAQVCVWQMHDMLSLCIQCGDNVGLLLDAWHWHHDPRAHFESIIEAGRERIVHVHISDAPNLPPEEIRDNERLLPGEGIIELRDFILTLRQTGYDDAISPEVFGRLDKLPADEAARQALQATRTHLA